MGLVFAVETFNYYSNGPFVYQKSLERAGNEWEDANTKIIVLSIGAIVLNKTRAVCTEGSLGLPIAQALFLLVSHELYGDIGRRQKKMVRLEGVLK